MKNKFLTLAICLFCLVVHAIGQDEVEEPVKWKINTAKLPLAVKPNDSFNLELLATIDKGWHLYSLQQAEGGPIPTRILLFEPQPFELGKIQAPKPIEFNDSAFGLVTAFYEDSAKFVLPVKVLETFADKSSKLKLKIRFQTCNDQICLAPKTEILELAFTGKNSENQ